MRACMVIWWCYWQQLCLLCGIACATLVVRALVTLPLQAWSHLCSSSSWPRMARPCISFTLFVLRPSSHLSWAIVPYSGAPVSLCRYCTSQPQYASREAANCEVPNAEKHRLQFTLERQGSAVPSSGCVVKRPRRAPVKALTVYPQKWGTSRMSRPYHRKITLSVI